MVDSNNQYSIPVPGSVLAANDQITATITPAPDAAGNPGTPASIEHAYQVDVTAPSITVDAPALTNDSTPTITGSTDLPTSSSISLTVTDANGNAQQFTAIVQPDGSYSADVPAPLPEGGYTVVASGTDAAGNQSTATDSGEFDIPAPTNNNPTANNDTLTTAEDTPVSITAASLLANDTDPDGDPLTLTSVQGAVNGTVALDASGNVVFTPNANYNGPASFTYTVSDGQGGTSTATVNLTVTAVNDAPTANNDTGAVTEDATLSVSAANGVIQSAGTAAGRDSDPDGDSLSVSAVRTGTETGGGTAGTVGAALVGTYGTLTLNADGSYVYVANRADALAAGATATDTFTYTVSDGQGGSDTAQLSITVTGTNDAPTTDDLHISGNEDTRLTINLHGSDVDGTISGYVISSLPGNGILYSDAAMTHQISAGDLVSGPVYFMPAPNWSGNASFQYAAQNNLGLRDATPATVNLNVLTVDDGTPVAVGDRFSTLLGTPITLTTAQLLSNDTLFDNARITATGSVSGGALVNNGDGTWTFTPSAIGTGTGSFTYTLTDDDGQTSTATVSITAYSGIDDLATVYESALPGGTGGGTTVATGNLLANDGNTSASITSVAGVTDGSANDTDTRAGYIGIDTAHGHLVVNTSGSGSGDYVYTLKSLADNSAPANNNSLTESIAYTTSNGSTAHLQVSIIDDRPQTVSRTVQVAEASQPDYNLLLVLDTSRSMTLAEAGGVVQSQAAGGSVSLTTRLDMAKIAMKNLISQYFDQASSVTVHLVTFGPSGTLVSYGGTTTFTSKTAALAAIDSISVSADGGTNYEAGLTAARKALDANSNGVVDNTSAQTVSYFISDGAPTSSNTNTATSAWNTFTANNGIQSYAIGVGSGITASTALNTIHNVDADSSGTRDSAIIIPDLNDLSGTLTNSVPTGYGGNVITDGQGSLTSALGADGGYIKTLTVKLDTDANGTADTNVTFSYNANSHQISWAGGHPAGSPISGDTLNLTSARGFTQGTLNFNFATGGYTYYTGGSASEGSSFSLSFVATDGDGDLTQPTTLTFAVVDGHPIARPDFDTLAPNGTSFTGNVITGLDTNSGLAEGTLVTDFTARGSSADTIVDNAHVTSIVFQGHTFNLAAANSGNVLGGSYTVNASGTLTWTHASNGSSLVFNSAGYYNYTPAKADLPNPPTSSTISVDLDWTPSASSGLSVTGRDENGNNASITYPNNLLTFWNNGAGVTGQGVNNSAMSSDVRNSPNRYLDALETMVFTFNSATHPHGVENLRFVINADNSNLGDRTSVGGASSLTYSVYHIDGHLLGTFTSTDEGTVTLPPEFSNVGSVEVQAASDTYARISGISYQSILTDDCDTVVAPVVIGYTLTDSDGDTSSSTLTLRSYTNALTGDDGNNTLNGTDVNDQLSGGGGNDVLNGGAGHDLLSGGHGNDILNGGSGDDFLFGGHGNDILNGGSGNDRLVGGAGNDVLTGGTGSDVFVWQLGDRGTVGTPAVDTITDFDKTTASGDALNLRDLLQGEQHSGTDLGNLTNYLHFTVAAGSTTIQISSQGAFGNGYNAAAVDQQIVLQGVDLSNGGSLANDQSIIQDLLNKGKLHVD